MSTPYQATGVSTKLLDTLLKVQGKVKRGEKKQHSIKVSLQKNSGRM